MVKALVHSVVGGICVDTNHLIAQNVAMTLGAHMFRKKETTFGTKVHSCCSDYQNVNLFCQHKYAR